ncbi:uncharacterized protein LOC127534365 isoform X3 [Acanthochromis polyacanthus]|uniref:uncharacterized protein LOC127534365 isoform X3 n=1 Tax=Acanthochromis polyacanthus TaxID=80966 RepID=UPI002234A8A3|nr:uncharacterized protein LOC127534365 isoform X3 [Acanthochromis polyacanthus]
MTNQQLLHWSCDTDPGRFQKKKMSTNRNDASEQLLSHLLERLRARLEHILGRMPLDLDFLEFTCTQELVFLNAVSSQATVCPAILDALTELHRLINLEKDRREQHNAVVQFEQGPSGRLRMVISPDYLSKLLELNLSVPCIARLLGMSRRTVYRRMAESDLSVRALYSSMTDEELDQCVREIKSRQPNSGYRMMKALLQARGLRVQYDRVRASMHRVDTTGVISRMLHVGCIARRTYSVPGPQSLMHIDTNHKLIRYNIIVFGGIDGFPVRSCILVQPLTTLHQQPWHSSKNLLRSLVALSEYVEIKELKTWMLHASCLQSVALEGTALYLGRVFTTKGSNGCGETCG